MLGWDLKLSIDGDYVDDGRGGFEKTDTIETMVVHQLHCQRNRWAPDPGLGCSAYLIPPKNSPSVALQMRDVYLQALQEFVDLGLAEDLVVEIEREQRGRLAVRSSIRDVQRGEIDLSNLLPYAPGD